MHRRLLIALTSTTLLLLTYFWTAANSPLIWSRYSKAAGLGIFHTSTDIVAQLATTAFFVAAAIIGVIAALQPAARSRKVLLVLPIYLIGFLITGVLLFVVQIGTIGSFTKNWISFGALAGALATIMIAVRMPLGFRAMRAVMRALSVASVLGALTWAGMVGIAVILLTNQPAEPPPGGAQASVPPFLISVGLATIFAIVALVSAFQGMRAAAAEPGAPIRPEAQLSYRAERGPILFSCVVISIIGFAGAQLLPVARVNAKADNAVVMQWDSPETLVAAQRACFDCHTNQTKWPWYSYVAPVSWLVVDHVEGGRDEINFDALNEMPTRRAANTYKHFAEQMEEGLMPPPDYMLMHPEARLTPEEREKLLKGFQASTLLTLPNQNK